MNTVQSEMQETGEGDVSTPHPRGAIPHVYSVERGDRYFAASPDTPHKDPASAHGTATGPIRQTLARPMGKTSLVKQSRQGGHQPALQPSIPHTSCPRTHPIICQAGDPGLTAG